MTDTLSHVERPSVAGTIVKLVALLPALAAALIPASLLATAGPATWTVAGEKPVGALLLSLGLAILAALTLVPTIRLVGRLGYERAVEIQDERLIVRERSIRGSQQTSIPLTAFDGLVHVVRTSLSGSRHELVLLDRRNGRQYIVMAADRIGRETIDAVSRRLGVNELPSSELLRRRGRTIGLGSEVTASAHAAA